MAKYDPFRALATRLIADFGRDVTLRRVSDDTLPDTDEPWIPADDKVEVDVTVKAVIVPFERNLIDGTLIQEHDKRCHISSQDIDDTPPTPKDLIIDGSRTYRIISIEETAPGAQQVLYILQLRS